MGGGVGRERPINAVSIAQRMCWEADNFLPRTAIHATRLTGTQMLLQSQVCGPNLRKPGHILLGRLQRWLVPSKMTGWSPMRNGFSRTDVPPRPRVE